MMSGVTEEPFKLFGRTIPVLSGKGKIEGGSVILPVEDLYTSSCFQDEGDEAPESDDESIGGSVPDELRSSSGSHDGCEEQKPNEGIRTSLENSGTGVPSVVQGADIASESCNDGEMQKNEEDCQGQATEKELKKPDKAVACPRCESLDTKFCYFNNYNVNQPRHFCKSCQRYWTAGGALRNVPVGAGRRKNKHTGAANQRGLFSEGLAVRGDPPDTAQQMNRQFKMGSSPSRLHMLPLEVCSLGPMESSSSSTILNFGQESPLSENMGATSFHAKRFQALQGQSMLSGKACGSFERDACSSGLLDMESKDLNEKQIHEIHGSDMSLKGDAPITWQPAGESASRSSLPVFQPPAMESKVDPSTPTELSDAPLGWTAAPPPFALVGGPWQFGNNLAWNAHPASAFSPPSTNGNPPQTFPSANHPLWSPLGGLWAGIPWPLMQTAMWGVPPWGGAWAMPWAPTASAAAAAVAATATATAATATAAAVAAATANQVLPSPMLGKHSREQAESDKEKGGSLWVPKTLRIDDPEEAARSSIWTTLGLGNKQESITSGGVFRAFQPKVESKEADDLLVQTLHSNPAAMTRSMAFQESNLATQKADAQGNQY